jgi:protein tyrosine phosphatase (PTP) superfamily phosphohydrolase (DUF442 family)
MTRAMWLSALAVMLFVSIGCRTTCERKPWCGRKDPPPAKPLFVPPPPPTPFVQPAPIQQSGGFPVLPPGAVVNPPPGANLIQPGQQAPPSFSKSPPDRSQTQWQPGEDREPTLQPESKRDVPPRIQLYAPEAIDRDNPRPANEPPVGKKPSVQLSFPAIPQFAVAKEKVYTGLRPPLDGLDWLQQNGVQTIVQIRLVGEDDSADKRHVEKRNLRYVAFEVSPVTLTKEKGDEFIKLIRDGARQGIFVYDQDGSLAGSMWYLYLRMAEVLDDDPAQIRARELGLQLNRDGQYRDMWLAVQKLISENSR